MAGWLDGWVGGWMGGWVGGWIDGWMEAELGSVLFQACTTLNPEPLNPYALHPIYTLNPEPYILNPTPYTLNPEL